MLLLFVFQELCEIILQKFSKWGNSDLFTRICLQLFSKLPRIIFISAAHWCLEMWNLGLGSGELRKWRETGSEVREKAMRPKQHWTQSKGPSVLLKLSRGIRRSDALLTLGESLVECSAYTLGPNLNKVIL